MTNTRWRKHNTTSAELTLGAEALTVLSADTQQVDDVLVFIHQLHQLHLRDQVRKVLVRGIVWRKTEQRIC